MSRISCYQQEFLVLHFIVLIAGGNIVKLLELGRELTELLTPHADFRLPLNTVICEYQKWFNRTLPFDPAVYGFSSFIDLLDVLPSIVEVRANLLSLACVDGGLRRSGKAKK